MAKSKKYQKKQRTALLTRYIILTILAVFLDVPIGGLCYTSFRAEGAAFVPYIRFPKHSLENIKDY